MPIDLTPILSAPLPIKIHLATVLPAFAIGAYLIFASKKGAPQHRVLGYVYLALMTITAATSLFIHEMNPNGFLGLSFIHLFVLLTIYGVVTSITRARAHNVEGHKKAMLGLFFGLVAAGALTLLPGRIMHGVFFR